MKISTIYENALLAQMSYADELNKKKALSEVLI